ncbi:Alpha/Beta hydrolase protein [Apodospora peruviana]|uniref:Carboxylic ester hydrolase n=1 Tax=Apodospora peruviana TaxID=516989 RepID=A0AAE0HWR5_9PEZI|nr:Alpha/Beta hydrolase protein [Apodospora peruviana]
MQLFLPIIFYLTCKASAQRPVVKLKDATYLGTTTKITTATATATVDKFLGIRFASTPSRFRAAQPCAPGNKTVDAVTQPPACAQQGTFASSEDCLFLNVFAPPHSQNPTTQTPKAVMLWFHGGALQSGSIASFDGSSLAANEDVIVVAAQYRLGVFGFPGNITRLGIPPDELNPGFRDQKLALQWIQENIASFGGDKTRVTIFGESAGAVSVDAQLLSDWGSEGPPFHAAILQSGGLHTFNRVALGVGVNVTGLGTGNQPHEAPFFSLARSLNCSADNGMLACVRTRTTAEIMSAVQKVNLLFPPVDDNGLSSVGDSDAARRAGRTLRVPVLIGSTFFEGDILPQKAIESRSLEEWAEMIYPGNSTLQDRVIEAYAGASDALKLLHSDFQFACTSTYDGNMISSLGIPTWRYVFNASLPGGRPAGHGSDVNFVFGSGLSTMTTANQRLSRKMQTAWASFAKNPAAGPGWPKYGSESLSLANLGGEGARDSITMADPGVVDSRCWVFSDAYDPDRPRSLLVWVRRKC